MGERTRILTAALAIRGHARATRQEIEEFQNSRLRRLVRHAYERVPFYRRLFDLHGIKPHHIRTGADLNLIPVTTRREMQAARPEDLIAAGTDHRRLRERRTSGMTGEPFRIWRSNREELLSSVLLAREYRLLGLQSTDKVAHVKMLGVPVTKPSSSRFGTTIARAGRILFQRHRTANVARVNAGLPLGDLIDSLKTAGPTVVAGYAGVLASVARRLSSLDDTSLRPRMVISGAEVLTERMREQIEAGFGSPVYDTYGCHELGRIATECVATGDYHICDDSVVVQVAGNRGDDGDLRAGHLTGTSLHSWSMPFIRYETGDVVVRGANLCACGLPFPTLIRISGRKYDYFHAADGSLVSPHRILDLVQMDAIGWIARYQFIQQSTGKLVMLIVPSVAPESEQLATLESRIGIAMGPGADIELRLVDEIADELSGKTRRFKSEVESDYD